MEQKDYGDVRFMPATEQAVTPLLRRLQSLRFAPDVPDSQGVRKEIGNTIMRAAENDAHAEQIVARIIRTQQTFPTPSEIWNAAEAETPAELTGSPVGTCPQCRGYGFAYVPDSPNTVRRCECWKR